LEFQDLIILILCSFLKFSYMVYVSKFGLIWSYIKELEKNTVITALQIDIYLE
jgi:hypothetical protein